MGKWKVHSLRTNPDNFGCLVVFVSILVVVLAAVSAAMYFLGYFPLVEAFIEDFGAGKLRTAVILWALFATALSFGLAYIGFGQMTIFSFFNIVATGLFAYYFYNATLASPVSEDFMVGIPITVWLSIVCAIAVTFIPSVIAATAVYFLNFFRIKKSDGYLLFEEKLDQFMPTQRLYKILVTSEKIAMRSPSGELWKVYFDEIGYDDLYGRAFDAFVFAVRVETFGKFTVRRLEDYSVSFTNTAVHKQVRAAIRAKKQARKRGETVSQELLIDQRPDSYFARDTRMIPKPPVQKPGDLSDEGEFLRKDAHSFGSDFKSEKAGAAPSAKESFDPASGKKNPPNA